MSPQPDQRSAIGLATEWVARLTVVGLEMVVFGLGGVWLDKRLSVEPLFALVGFAIGIGIGIAHLLAMTAPGRKRAKGAENSAGSDHEHGPSGTGRKESDADRKEIDE